jgi:hypothetical protein
MTPHKLNKESHLHVRKNIDGTLQNDNGRFVWSERMTNGYWGGGFYLFIFFFILLLHWGYTVTSEKVLIIYHI